MFDLDTLLAQPVSPLVEGWVGWVPHQALSMPTSNVEKVRPWARGRVRSGYVEWFPRTSKEPREGTRYAIASAANDGAGLPERGWFLANAYVRTEHHFDPMGKETGRLRTADLAMLYKGLDNLYWDERRGRR